MSKTHYRKVFKSDHLGSADLEEFQEEGKPLNFTIRDVKQEIGAKVAGRKGDFNIAYFVEKIKPMVLNVVNSKQIEKFAGTPFVEDWKNIRVTLYIDTNVRFGGELVSGIRINSTQPKPKPKPVFTEKNFEAANAKSATIELIKKGYSITPDMEKKYLDYVATKK